jgi:hypothetical protein
MTTQDVRHAGNSGPRVLTVTKAGSVKYRQRKINLGMPYRGQKVRVTEVKDYVTVHVVDGEQLLRAIVDPGPVGTHHGSGAKRGRPRKDAKAAA